MKPLELIYSILGYGSVAGMVLSVLATIDGRLQLSTGVILFTAFLLVNAVASFGELYREQDSREWIRNVFNATFTGDIGEVRNAWSQDDAS